MQQRDRIDQAESAFVDFILALAAGKVGLEVTKKPDPESGGEVTTYCVVVDGTPAVEHL